MLPNEHRCVAAVGVAGNVNPRAGAHRHPCQRCNAATAGGCSASTRDRITRAERARGQASRNRATDCSPAAPRLGATTPPKAAPNPRRESRSAQAGDRAGAQVPGQRLANEWTSPPRRGRPSGRLVDANRSARNAVARPRGPPTACERSPALPQSSSCRQARRRASPAYASASACPVSARVTLWRASVTPYARRLAAHCHAVEGVSGRRGRSRPSGRIQRQFERSKTSHWQPFILQLRQSPW